MCWHLSHMFSNSCRRIHRYILAFCWLLGLLWGSLFALWIDEEIFETLRFGMFAELSIVSLLAITLFPIALVLFAARLSRPHVLYLLVFLKALSFAFVMTGYLDVFACSGWLIGSMLMFSDIAMTPLLWYILLRSEQCDVGVLRNSIFFSVVSATVIVFLDYCFVVPFWADLLLLRKG